LKEVYASLGLNRDVYGTEKLFVAFNERSKVQRGYFVLAVRRIFIARKFVVNNLLL
jgi:hypothetical protein